MSTALDNLLTQVNACRLCESQLEHGVRPVLQASPEATILVAGQAPGAKVHATGIPFNDPSGDRLREWMGIDRKTFYDPQKIAILPMGFCYPGKGKSGDLPHLKICGELWQDKVFTELKSAKLIVLIGKYAQDYYLKDNIKMNLTDRVKDFKSYLPKYFVLPHPSPRNNIWQAKNEWFKHLVLPEFKDWTTSILGKH